MNFKDYVENLTTLLKDNPELGDLLVITAKDDEGNGFNEVWSEPTLGEFNSEYNGEFCSESDFKEETEYFKDMGFEKEYEVNAICVN